MLYWQLSVHLQRILLNKSLASLAHLLARFTMLLSNDLLLKILLLIRWRWIQMFEISPMLQNTRIYFTQWISQMHSSFWTHFHCHWSLIELLHRIDHLNEIFQNYYHYCHYFSLLLHLDFLSREYLLLLLLLWVVDPLSQQTNCLSFSQFWFLFHNSQIISEYFFHLLFLQFYLIQEIRLVYHWQR